MFHPNPHSVSFCPHVILRRTGGDSFTGVRYFTSMPPTSYELRWPANSVANSIQFERYRMKRKLVTSFGLAVGLLMICAPVFAHHGGSDYDTQNLLTLKGTVTEFLWENPHCQVFLDVKKDDSQSCVAQRQRVDGGIIRRRTTSATMTIEKSL